MKLSGQGNLLPIGNTFANIKSREQAFQEELVSKVNKLTKVPRNATNTVVFQEQLVDKQYIDSNGDFIPLSVMQEAIGDPATGGVGALPNGTYTIGLEIDQFARFKLPNTSLMKLNNVTSLKVVFDSYITFAFTGLGTPPTPDGDYSVPLYYQIIAATATGLGERIIFIKLGDINYTIADDSFSYTPSNLVTDWIQTIPYRRTVSNGPEELDDFNNTDILNYSDKITANQLQKLLNGEYTFFLHNWGVYSLGLSTNNKAHWDFECGPRLIPGPESIAFLNITWIYSGTFANFTPVQPYTL